MSDATEINEPIERLEATQSFLQRAGKMLIGGQWVDSASGKKFKTINPATGDQLAEVAEGDKEDVNRAVAAARGAFENPAWRNMMPTDRERLIRRFIALIEDNIDELSELETLDCGKPIGASRYVDLPLTIDTLYYYAGFSTKLEGDVLPHGCSYTPEDRYFAYTQREPVGVVGMIIPWNFPLLLLSMKLGPALATGCTCVIKPAEDTPLSTLRLAELAQEAGLPDGVINVVPGYGETAGAAIANHPDVDKCAFTGSTEVGKSIVNAASGNLKRLSLELGGKAPNLVLEDADIEAAIAGATMAIYTNQGEICCAGSRLYVHRSIFDQVIEGIVDNASKTKVGPGLNPASEMGPLINQAQLDRVCNYVDGGRSEGAEILVGGGQKSGKGFFYEPTVMVNTKPDMRVVKEEIFGPVLTAMPFDSLDDVIKDANDTIYGLSAGIWTRDVSKAHQVAAQLNAGTVWVNCFHIFDVTQPFGGYKQSGWGREWGRSAVEHYTEVKSVCIKM
ncbi:MAG: aldehyde dehydrogenase family protein [Gammaproteobacteria bacterium]|jgi:phenylacetaldehyde dehydrogenase|nr:aldehyde dehydrogenase family protein [Gammaproteobacteria bacterium]MBT4811197.1 aldehyde dehydrogenase family protein [Thiotrichales bacterium]MBT5634403.1 aldehyde dehydrogenase family protein [Gammaproteobacteria bacterium]MBT6079360.1 aldehyde dehydrogenase family protein [Gammaproteobacteria bacterium]MBT7230444.1 aldehyde dehydrogenase family protein [Gammaproteobacteria bacterium]